jgi:predicted transcriptional regulator
MSAKQQLPTDAELAILGVLWQRGPCTVREVHEALSPTQGTGYTTVLKLMQLMAQKSTGPPSPRRKLSAVCLAI